MQEAANFAKIMRRNTSVSNSSHKGPYKGKRFDMLDKTSEGLCG